MLPALWRFLESLAQQTDGAGRTRISDGIYDAAATNQFGERRHIRRDFIDSGLSIVFNTMYTTCKGSCPGTSATIERLRGKLAPLFGESLTFVSLTLEPEIDTPAALLGYSKTFGAGRLRKDLCGWEFLTTSRPETERLRRSLGFFDLNPVIDSDTSQHGSLLLAGNPKLDRWASFPAELADSTLLDGIRRICGHSFEQRYGVKFG